MWKAPRHPYLLAWLCWLIFSLGLLAVFAPKVRSAYERSGVREMLANRSTETVARSRREVTVTFIDSKLRSREYVQWQKKLGGDVYHDTLEALLSGPTMENVCSGGATFISPSTKLIGCTLESRVFFADFSKEFLDSRNIELATREITDTLKRFPNVDKVVVLVEGEPLDQILARNEASSSPDP